MDCAFFAQPRHIFHYKSRPCENLHSIPHQLKMDKFCDNSFNFHRTCCHLRSLWDDHFQVFGVEKENVIDEKEKPRQSSTEERQCHCKEGPEDFDIPNEY